MIDRMRGCFPSFATAVRAFALLAAGFAHSARAETVEIAPGVQVTKRTYAAPIIEQPFFGFADKTAAQREADDKFVQALLQAVGTREKALDETTKRGWRALAAGKPGEAALRFNQAYLVSPEQSRVYHGLAVIAQTRFNDIEFAEELFRIAKKQPNPLKMLNADYGRLLLIAKRPKDAQPVLEQAVQVRVRAPVRRVALRPAARAPPEEERADQEARTRSGRPRERKARARPPWIPAVFSERWALWSARPPACSSRRSGRSKRPFPA